MHGTDMVQNDPPAPAAQPGPLQDGKKLLGIAIVVIVIIAVAAAAVLLAGGGTPSGTVSSATNGAAPGGSTAGGSGASPGSAAALPGAGQKPVDFTLQTSGMTSCGLTCRDLTATITNTGTEGAHNVCISLSMENSRGEVIGLNGAGTLQKCIGDLAAGERRSEQVTINADCGLFATKCIRETLTLHTVATSDEATIRFPDSQLSV